MEFQEAISRFAQVLEEERAHPTVNYRCANESSAATQLAFLLSVDRQREMRPRSVCEDPQNYVFESVNFRMLTALLSQVNDKDRPGVIGHMLSRVLDVNSFQKANTHSYPIWKWLVSELPLVAEFCIRTNEKQVFFRAVAESKPAPGLLLLLMHLGEMLWLNFNIFTENDLERLANAASCVRNGLNENSEKILGLQLGVDVTGLTNQLDSISYSIVEQCRKARYLHLKGTLLLGMNLEVNQDKTTVEGYLQKLGFNQNLVASLNHAEQLYRSPSPFDLKSCLGHLRSFLEILGLEAAQRVHAKKAGGAKPIKWGEAANYLRQTAVLSEKEWAFVTSLYTLISDAGVHTLISEQEYARLLRNVVIEIGLLLLSRLEKLGI